MYACVRLEFERHHLVSSHFQRAPVNATQLHSAQLLRPRKCRALFASRPSPRDINRMKERTQQTKDKRHASVTVMTKHQAPHSRLLQHQRGGHVCSQAPKNERTLVLSRRAVEAATSSIHPTRSPRMPSHRSALASDHACTLKQASKPESLSASPNKDVRCSAATLTGSLILPANTLSDHDIHVLVLCAHSKSRRIRVALQPGLGPSSLVVDGLLSLSLTLDALMIRLHLAALDL